MILHHKAKKIDDRKEIKGFITKLQGQYYITQECAENIGYPVDKATIEPCLEELGIYS